MKPGKARYFPKVSPIDWIKSLALKKSKHLAQESAVQPAKMHSPAH